MTDHLCRDCRWMVMVPDPDHGADRAWCKSPQVAAWRATGMSRCAFERDIFPEPWRTGEARKCGPEALNFERRER